MDEKALRTTVEKVIADVRRNGDAALVRLAARFDKVRLTPATLRVPQAELRRAYRAVSPGFRSALEECASRIKAFHAEERRRLPKSWTVNRGGVRIGQTFSPVDAVGAYVPGGRFAYPSTVLMTAIPARIAGVERVVMVTPPARLSNEILAAAHIAGVDAVYRVGGPAAVAALAFGTRTVPRVDMVVGPGNALVTEAKRQVFGAVGIDLLAGPSELVVVADDSADADFVAADLAAQAEHDPDSTGLLISLSAGLIARVRAALPAGLRKQCRYVLAKDAAHAAELSNEAAGEHVEVVLRNPGPVMALLRHGGTFFVNGWSPAVMGDYWAGPSHVLPTARSARFGSGLSVASFVKRSGYVEISEPAFRKGAPAARRIADLEGLVQHAGALGIRGARKGKS